MGSYSDSTGWGPRVVATTFGRGREIEEGECKKRTFFSLKSIPGHSNENLHICYIVLESHLVRKHCGIM